MKKPVKKSSRENIYSLTGFGKVFGFTLKQTLKNKSFIVVAIVMILMMGMMKPFMYLMTKSGENAKQRTEASLDNVEADKLTIYNETQFVFDQAMEIVPGTNDRPSGAVKNENIKFLNIDEGNEDDLIAALGPKDILVIIRGESAGYKVNGIIADKSDITVKSLDRATDYVQERFEKIRQAQMKLDQQTIQSISSGVSTGSVLSENEYKDEQNYTMSAPEYNGLVIGFSIIVMIVASLAASYIIASVNEEKQSKLAESLLVSVRPMALLMGKVISMLCFVAATIVLGVFCAFISEMIMEKAMHLDLSKIGQGGINFAIFTSYGVKGLVVQIAEILLALCSFGVLSGILGSACAKVEDQQNATTTVTMITMIGYLGAVMLGLKPDYGMISALVPPISFFSAPAAYLGGRVGLEIMLLSFAIQIVILVALVILAAKTYRNLLLSDSSKPKLASIFAAAKY